MELLPLDGYSCNLLLELLPEFGAVKQLLVILKKYNYIFLARGERQTVGISLEKSWISKNIQKQFSWVNTQSVLHLSKYFQIIPENFPFYLFWFVPPLCQLWNVKTQTLNHLPFLEMFWFLTQTSRQKQRQVQTSGEFTIPHHLKSIAILIMFRCN